MVEAAGAYRRAGRPLEVAFAWEEAAPGAARAGQLDGVRRLLELHGPLDAAVFAARSVRRLAPQPASPACAQPPFRGPSTPGGR